MYFSSLTLLPLLSASALASVLLRQSSGGSIAVPAPGTAIAPGSNFTFLYGPRADSGVSTFQYHVFLLDEAATESPVAIKATDVFSTGYFFGSYDYANYTAVPYATHPAPPELTMPDFSVSPGGFANGMTGSNVKMQLVVVEEYGDGSPVGLGFKLGMAVAKIIYNATTSS